MKVAVTGATGFLGMALIQRLLEEGHDVLALVRDPDRDRARLPAGVAVDVFDALAPAPKGLLLGYEAVVHLAGAPISERWTPAHKQRVRESREKGTQSIARSAVESKTVKVLVSASAVGYYGPRGNEELTESCTSGDDFLAEVCRVWEKGAVDARAHGIRTVHPRIGVVLHPEGGALRKMLPPFKLGAGARLGSGQQYMSWIHRDDLVRLLLFLLTEKSLVGPVNATAPHPVTNAEFTRALGRALRRPALLSTPAFALRLAMGEMADMLLTGQRVMPRKALEAGFEFRYPTLDEALSALFRQQAA